ncbi:MAG: prenyltransferase/squalene oxidase repeat-containing protein [Rubrivivax sp.]
MLKRIKLLATALFMGVAAGSAWCAPGDMDPALRAKAQRAVDAGAKYLIGKQAANGSLLNSVGLTALALTTIVENPSGTAAADKEAIGKYAKFLVSNAHPDGSIVERAHDETYNTAVAIAALAALKDPAYAPLIAAGQKYIVGSQSNESRNITPDNSWYGGIGYGGEKRPDVSNLYVALEAMRKTDFDPADPVWQKALVFASRMQNRSESNDQKWAGNDGGFVYAPGDNLPKMGGGTNSYGSMTAAGLYSLLLIGVKKTDPRVQAAYKWLTTNYTLDSNFGVGSKSALFYFYCAFAKVMSAYGEKEFVDGRGVRHNWRNELAEKLISLQDADGSWVNRDSKDWWENRPELVTSWSAIALEHVLK